LINALLLPSSESTTIRIICENYTPNGVVVVVDVVPTKFATKEVAVKREEYVLLFIILFQK